MFKRGKTDKDDQESQWKDVEPFFDGAASDNAADADADGADADDAPESDDRFAGLDTFVDTENDDDEPFLDEEFAADDAFASDSAEEFFDGDDEADIPVENADDDEASIDEAFDDSDGISEEIDEEPPAEEGAVADAAAQPASAAVAPAPAPAAPAKVSGGKHGKHGQVKEGKAALDDLPEHQRKARRTRKILIVVIILLIALIIGMLYAGYQFVTTGSQIASQQTNQSTSDVSAANNAENSTKDASTTTTKKTSVPSLTSVMGKTQDEAVKAIGHGATVSMSSDVNEEGNAMKKRVTVVLTSEPADSKSGTPTVYLGLNEAGQVIMAGYSAATASLGYGTLSFADAVSNEHIIEKTLNEAGLNVPSSAVTLPAKSTYSTYAGDGTTLMKESCSFNGTSTVGSANYTWSSVLVYDYTAANASGNLANTVRQIYIYINAA